MSLADSCLSLADRIFADFHRQVLMWVPLPGLVHWAQETGLELRSHTLQGGTLTTLISLWNLSHCP